MQALSRATLPPLIVDNVPKVLHSMNVTEMRGFIPAMLKAVFGLAETHSTFNFGDHEKPQWWPREIAWSSQFYELIPKTEDRACYLRHIITACYMHYKQEDILYLFDSLPNEPPRWRLVQVENNIWTLLRRSDQLPIWHFPNTFRVLPLLALRAQQDSMLKSSRRKHNKQRLPDAKDIPARNTRRTAPIGAHRWSDDASSSGAREEQSAYKTDEAQHLPSDSTSGGTSSFGVHDVVSSSGQQPHKISIMGANRMSTNMVDDDRDLKDFPQIATGSLSVTCSNCHQTFAESNAAIEHELNCFVRTKKQKEKNEYLHAVGLLPNVVAESLVNCEFVKKEPINKLPSLDSKKLKTGAELAALAQVPISSILGRLLHGLKEKEMTSTVKSEPKEISTPTKRGGSKRRDIRSAPGKGIASPQPLCSLSYEADCNSFEKFLAMDKSLTNSSDDTVNYSNPSSAREMSIGTASKLSPAKPTFYPIDYRPLRIVRHYHELKLTNADRRKWWHEVRRKGLNKECYKLYKQTCRPVEVRLPTLPNSMLQKLRRPKPKSNGLGNSPAKSRPPQRPADLLGPQTKIKCGRENNLRKRTRSLSTCIAMEVKKRLAKSQLSRGLGSRVLSYRKLHNGHIDSALFRTVTASHRKGISKVVRPAVDVLLPSPTKRMSIPEKASSSGSSTGSCQQMKWSPGGTSFVLGKRSPVKASTVSQFCQNQKISLVPISLPTLKSATPVGSEVEMQMSTSSVFKDCSLSSVRELMASSDNLKVKRQIFLPNRFKEATPIANNKDAHAKDARKRPLVPTLSKPKTPLKKPRPTKQRLIVKLSPLRKANKGLSKIHGSKNEAQSSRHSPSTVHKLITFTGSRQIKRCGIISKSKSMGRRKTATVPCVPCSRQSQSKIKQRKTHSPCLSTSNKSITTPDLNGRAPPAVRSVVGGATFPNSSEGSTSTNGQTLPQSDTYSRCTSDSCGESDYPVAGGEVVEISKTISMPNPSRSSSPGMSTVSGSNSVTSNSTPSAKKSSEVMVEPKCCGTPLDSVYKSFIGSFGCGSAFATLSRASSVPGRKPAILRRPGLSPVKKPPQNPTALSAGTSPSLPSSPKRVALISATGCAPTIANARNINCLSADASSSSTRTDAEVIADIMDLLLTTVAKECEETSSSTSIAQPHSTTTRVIMNVPSRALPPSVPGLRLYTTNNRSWPSLRTQSSSDLPMYRCTIPQERVVQKPVVKYKAILVNHVPNSIRPGFIRNVPIIKVQSRQTPSASTSNVIPWSLGSPLIPLNVNARQNLDRAN